MVRGGSGTPTSPACALVGWCAARCVPLSLPPIMVAALQPQQGLAGAPMILVAMAFGAVISAAVPRLRYSLIVSSLVAGMLITLTHLMDLQEDGRDTGHDWNTPQMQLRGGPASFNESGLAPTNLQTLSVVLPCAFEGNFAVQTIDAIWENTEHDRIYEIVVVDDGSRPTLRSQFPERLLNGAPDQPKVTLLRHEKTQGLITAKKHGGDAARGDVIVFLDCHVSPRKGWEEAVFKQMKRYGDYKTVVVPTITSLDPDTWKEILNGANGKACYILWNADFTWLSDPGRDIPLMSGGLLAISRRWWDETGGYDEHMVAWGGENIDQSLRIWLCGGRIEVADGAFIAHMWRDPKNPKTQLRYPIPTKDVMRNKARAVTAWFGEWTEKVMTFPEYEQFTKEHESLGDMSNFDALKARLQCKPFQAYLSRFSYVYFDTGLLPEEVFQIREVNSGTCLERVAKEDGGASQSEIVLMPCSGGEGGGPVTDLQLWHPGNRDRDRTGRPCCSGIMNWNFLQCMDAQAVGQNIKTFDCEIGGLSQNQRFSLAPEAATESGGDLLWRKSHGVWGDAQGCISTIEPPLADAKFSSFEACRSSVVSDDPEVRKFRLRRQLPSAPDGACATAVGNAGGNSLSGFKLSFQKCNPDDSQQTLHKSELLDGFQIEVGDTSNCLDSSSGNELLVYPCYDHKTANPNQVFQIRDGKLCWKDFCVDSQEEVSQNANGGLFSLRTCAPKDGQRFRRESIDSDGTFLLRDADTGKCLAQMPGSSNPRHQSDLGIAECGPEQRWRELLQQEQVQHVASSLCIDSSGRGGLGVQLYQCHSGRAMTHQRFEIVDTPGWLRNKARWGDNGRRRWFETCLDRAPVRPVSVSVQQCKVTRQRGTRWVRWNVHKPLERQFWDASEKYTGPPIGSKPAPP